MGMSTHVVAFRPPDEKWQQMKAIWDACNAAKVAVPDEVDDYFRWEPPDPAGVEIDLDDHASLRKWSDDSRSGYEVVIADLPPDVAVVRFYNSW